MSDKMIPPSFEQLLKDLLKEYKESNSFLAVPVKRRKEKAYESKIGPAAGPHTQLAGNMIAAYGAGASHFELKTVQILEGEALGIVKPCIYSAQEVYNTEWSTELTVSKAQDEYIKAYLLLKVLIQEFGLGDIDGFHFIMSVGYDLAGIQSEKIDSFIENLKNASETKEWKKDINYLLQNLHLFEHITKEEIEAISPVISSTIALSTMHGCKSEEIKAIASYLIEEKKLNTYVKMNPTLLGKEEIQSILQQMGYQHIQVEDKTFEDDIKFETAVQMLRSLQMTASNHDLTFGVKLTNTLPVVVKRNELIGETMYLSGAALYPIALGVAAKLSMEFEGQLLISYSGGADCNNIKEILETGIYPVTISSVLLKVGGYKNITRMNEKADQVGRDKEAAINVSLLEDLAKKAVLQEAYHQKERKCLNRTKEYSSLCAKCNNCIDVCPNRANKKFFVKDKAYILHYDNLCNECGNCSFYCVEGHDPYLDKMTVFQEERMFQESNNQGFFQSKNEVIYRIYNNEEKEQIKSLEEYYEF